MLTPKVFISVIITLFLFSLCFSYVPKEKKSKNKLTKIGKEKVEDGIDVKIIQEGKTNKEIDGLLSDIQQLDIKKKEIELGETAELFLNLKDLEQEEKVIKAKLEKKKHSKNVYREKINTEEEKKKTNEKIKKKIDLDATCEYVFAFNKEKKQ